MGVPKAVVCLRSITGSVKFVFSPLAGHVFDCPIVVDEVLFEPVFVFF
jgi:hypothetical protein